MIIAHQRTSFGNGLLVTLSGFSQRFPAMATGLHSPWLVAGVSEEP